MITMQNVSPKSLYNLDWAGCGLCRYCDYFHIIEMINITVLN